MDDENHLPEGAEGLFQGLLHSNPLWGVATGLGLLTAAWLWQVVYGGLGTTIGLAMAGVAVLAVAVRMSTQSRFDDPSLLTRRPKKKVQVLLEQVAQSTPPFYVCTHCLLICAPEGRQQRCSKCNSHATFIRVEDHADIALVESALT